MLTLLIAAPPPTGRWGAIQLRQSAHSPEHFRRGNAWSDLAILRTTPALLGLFSLVTLWAGELIQAPAAAARGRLVRQKGAHLQRCHRRVRRALWCPPHFSMSRPGKDVIEIPTTLLQRLVQTVCYAA